MAHYLFKRILLIIPTLLGIVAINFFVVQLAPGGPVEQMMAKMSDIGENASLSNLNGTSSELLSTPSDGSFYKGARGLDDEILIELQKMYGFDKPLFERFFLMLKNYLFFDFGDSFFRDISVVDLVIEKMPVSISLGILSTLLVYLISIPLGIKKAVSSGSVFDVYTSSIMIVLYSVPVFLFAIVLIIFFAGGEYFNWFPLRGIVSDDFASLGVFEKVKDFLWHLALPIFAMSVGSFATLAMLSKNSFLDEINKQYVLTARSKGLSENKILYSHIFRNAMLIIIAGFPAVFISAFFTGSLLIEIIFSLDGLGLLGYESTIQRDYPVMFGTLYIFTLLSLAVGIINDIVYTWIDPRIDFESREY